MDRDGGVRTSWWDGGKGLQDRDISSRAVMFNLEIDYRSEDLK